jgi:hypothetical protein
LILFLLDDVCFFQPVLFAEVDMQLDLLLQCDDLLHRSPDILQGAGLVCGQSSCPRKLYQEEVVLNHVVPEVLHGQGGVAHSLNEFMLCVLFPRLLDVLTVQQVRDELATGAISKPPSDRGPVTCGVNGSVYVE